MTLTEGPTFPPLLRGEEVRAGQDPLLKAASQAAIGTDPGLICWQIDATYLRTALVLAPEEPLATAMEASFAVALGFGDALGALAPPEVAVHFDWPGGFRVNGAECGHMRAIASTADPSQVPDWLVVGMQIPFLPPRDDEPGLSPTATCLIEEGCGEVTPLMLLESWSRHTLVWINRLMEDGFEPLHAAWRERAWEMGEALPEGGIFMGLDEIGGRLVKNDTGTRIEPLTLLLENVT